MARSSSSRPEPATSTVTHATTAQPVLTEQAQQTGATTTDPAVGARAVDAGVKVDPRTGQITERGPAGPEIPTETVTADAPLFVRVGDSGAGRRLMGEDAGDQTSFVLYLEGDAIPPEHRHLPKVRAVHRAGVWEPAG
jgi:hypothetical protein